METFILQDSNRVTIPLLEGLPKEYEKEYGIPGAVQKHAYYGKYPMLFQEIKSGRYELAISDYLIRNRSKLTCRANVICLELHFLLTGKVLYNLKDLDWRVLEAGHHNMIALSDVKNETFFKITPASTCDVHFMIEDIVRFSEKYPQLRILLDTLSAGGHTSLFIRPQKTTPLMLHIIVQIKEAVKAGKADDEHTIAMIEKLVVMVLENKPVASKYKYAYTDIEKIHKAHDLIGRYVEEKDILSSKVKESGLRPDKFREGFVLLYGLLPSRYLLDKRLQKADQLVREQRAANLDDLAEMCGFKSESQLAKDYYFKYGIKISELIHSSKN